MILNYTDADGKTLELEVTDDFGQFYLSSLEEEKKSNRRNTRPDRHTSLESFTYEDRRYFDSGIDIAEAVATKDAVSRTLAQLSKRQRYLLRMRHVLATRM